MTQDGGRFMWRYIYPGEVLGAVTILDGGPYPTTVEAVDPSLIRFIPTEAFFQWRDEYRRVERQLLEQVGSKYYDALERATEFAAVHSPLARLAGLLYRLWEHKQSSGSGVSPVWIYMSRQDMADSIGVKTPEWISRLMKKLVKREIVWSCTGVIDSHSRGRRKGVEWGCVTVVKILSRRNYEHTSVNSKKFSHQKAVFAGVSR